MYRTGNTLGIFGSTEQSQRIIFVIKSSRELHMNNDLFQVITELVLGLY